MKFATVKFNERPDPKLRGLELPSRMQLLFSKLRTTLCSREDVNVIQKRKCFISNCSLESRRDQLGEEEEEEEVSDDVAVAVGLAWLGKIVYLEQHISSHSSLGRARTDGRTDGRTPGRTNDGGARHHQSRPSSSSSSSSSSPILFLSSPDRPTADRPESGLGSARAIPPQQPPPQTPELHSYFAEWMMTMRPTTTTTTKAAGTSFPSPVRMELAQCGLILRPYPSLRRVRPRRARPFADPFEPCLPCERARIDGWINRDPREEALSENEEEWRKGGGSNKKQLTQHCENLGDDHGPWISKKPM